MKYNICYMYAIVQLDFASSPLARQSPKGCWGHWLVTVKHWRSFKLSWWQERAALGPVMRSRRRISLLPVEGLRWAAFHHRRCWRDNEGSSVKTSWGAETSWPKRPLQALRFYSRSAGKTLSWCRHVSYCLTAPSYLLLLSLCTSHSLCLGTLPPPSPLQIWACMSLSSLPLLPSSKPSLSQQI